MKNVLTKKPADGAGVLELGAIIGQRKAFSLVAGRCSAAEAAAIRRIREERLYQAANLSWKEFCPRHLGVSRSQADHLIQLLEKFGPDYFAITQLTRIPLNTYRAIAPSVRDGHIHWRSEAIPLVPDHSQKITAAVAGLLEEARPPAPLADPAPPADPAPAPRTPANDLAALCERTTELVAEWAKLVAGRAAFPPAERQAMKNRIARTRLDLQRLEQQVWNR